MNGAGSAAHAVGVVPVYVVTPVRAVRMPYPAPSRRPGNRLVYAPVTRGAGRSIMSLCDAVRYGGPRRDLPQTAVPGSGRLAAVGQYGKDAVGTGSSMKPNQKTQWETAAWADTFRTALMMVRACRDDDTDAYWILYGGVPEDRGPLLVKLLAVFAAVGRDDEWFQVRLARITEAEVSGELLAKVRDWARETG